MSGDHRDSTVAGKENIVVREPKGVVGVISPWNFPFNLSIRAIAASALDEVENTSRSTSRRYPAGFWSVWVTVAMDLLGFGIIIPLLPLYADSFGASPASAGRPDA